MKSTSNNRNPNWLIPLRCLLFHHHYPVKSEEIYQLAQKSNAEQPIVTEDINPILNHFNLTANWKEYSWPSMRYCELPAMLVLNDGNAVALLSLHKNFAVISGINEDKIENRRVSLDALKVDFSGKVLQIDPQESQAVSSNRLRISEWIDRKTLGITIFEIIIASLMINLFQVALPLYTMNVYDKVIPNQAVETLWVLCSGVLVILLLDYLFRLVRGVVLENLSERVGEALEMRMMKKSITSNSGSREHVGAEADMFHEMTNYRAGFFGRTLVELIEIPFFFLFFLIIYGISPEVAMIPLIAAAVITMINLFHHFPLQRLGKELFALKKKKESFLIQTISGRDSLRLANALSKFMYRWQSSVRKTLSLGRASQLWNMSMSTTTPIIVQGVSVMVIFVGSFQVFAGQLTVGGMVAATILSARAILPILNFSNALTRLFSSRHMLKAWKFALTKPSDFDLHDNLLNKGNFKGNLMVKNVRFKYQSSSSWVIDNFSIQVKAGEHLGVVGASGAGKSSLMSLLSGLERPAEGIIQLDTYDIKDIHPFEFYRNVSYMSQNPAFFSGTARDNIQLNTTTDHERLDHLIQAFGMNELIGNESIDGGLSFDVGESGKNLSGGQRQLIALMRCLYIDAPVYILDEPTSGMDGQLEAQVIKCLSEFLQSRTLLLVTHRPGLLTLVNRLIVLHKGRVLDDGPRDILMQKYFGMNSSGIISDIPLKQAKVGFK